MISYLVPVEPLAKIYVPFVGQPEARQVAFEELGLSVLAAPGVLKSQDGIGHDGPGLIKDSGVSGTASGPHRPHLELAGGIHSTRP